MDITSHVLGYGNLGLLRLITRPVAIAMEVSYGRHLWSTPWQARSVEAGRPTAEFLKSPPRAGRGRAQSRGAYRRRVVLRRTGGGTPEVPAEMPCEIPIREKSREQG